MEVDKTLVNCIAMILEIAVQCKLEQYYVDRSVHMAVIYVLKSFAIKSDSVQAHRECHHNS